MNQAAGPGDAHGRAQDGDVRDVLTALRAAALLPVVTVTRADQAVNIAQALVDGGIPFIEITFRTEAASAAIAAVRRNVPITIAAGSVIRAQQVAIAANAGAHLIVTPGFSRSVTAAASDSGIPVIPGVATATDIIAALDSGISNVKLFPANVHGGTGLLRALAAPFPDVNFVPTGGITALDLPVWLTHPSVLAVGGTWLTDQDLLNRGDYRHIRQRAAEATQIVAAAR